MQESPSGLSQLVRAITGARADEQGRVILCFLALHTLLVSYYLIKPLRNSQFLKEFDPDFLPVVTFGVVLLSFAVTKLFGFLADRVEKYRLVTGAYLTIMAIKVAFTWLLMYAGKSAVLSFYFFASVYFLLAIATMWACTNDIFNPEQGERCYGFIAVGSTLGSIVGSKISGLLTASPFKNYAPIASALCMGLSLALLLVAARRRRDERDREAKSASQEPGYTKPQPRGEFWADVAQIARRPYVRRIGLMVVILAIFSSSLDYISNAHIDEEVTKQQYAAIFPYLPADQYTIIYELKQKIPAERRGVLEGLARSTGQPPERLLKDYDRYQQDGEGQTRSIFSDVSYYQGILGILLLLVVARVIFSQFGVRHATVILPLVAAAGTIAFAFPLGLGAIQLVIVVAGAANYSLNNAAKEVLYTASDEDTKFKYKPLIEGPGMRLGDVMAATLAILLEHLSHSMGWGESFHQHALLGIVFLAVMVWLRAAYMAGLEYDTVRRQKHSQSRPAPEEP